MQNRFFNKGYPLLSPHVLLFVAFMTMTSSSLYGESIKLKYEDLSQLVAKQNKANKAASMVKEARQERVGSIAQSFMPSLTTSATSEYFKSGTLKPATQPSWHVEASVNVYRGGRDALEIDTQLGQVAMAEAEQERVYRQELHYVRTLYWRLVAEREKIRVWKDIQNLHAKNRKRAARRVARGLGTNSDLLSFDLFNQKIIEEIASGEHELRLLEMELGSRLHLANVSLVTDEEIPHQHDEDLIKREAALAKNPELKALNSEARYFQSLSEISSSWWLPTVDLFANYGLFPSRDNPEVKDVERTNWAVGVRASLSLYDKQTSRRAAQSEALQSRAKEEQAAHVSQVLATEVRKSHEEMLHLHELVHSSDVFLKQGGKLLEQILNEYDRGVKSSEDVLSAIENLVALKEQDLKRRLDYQEEKAKLLAILGL